MTTALAANEGTLRACRLFRGVDPSLVAELARASTRVRASRGEHLWRAGAQPSHFTVIASGLVRISRVSPEGTETILAFFGPRESIGDVAVLSGRPYPADAVVLSDGAEVICVDAEVIRRASAESGALLASMNASLIEHTQALQEKISILTAGTIDKRLSTLLLYLATRFGDEADDGTTLVPIQLSRSEVARVIGATIETTSRTFSRFQREGLVETTSDGFVLRDAAALERLTRA